MFLIDDLYTSDQAPQPVTAAPSQSPFQFNWPLGDWISFINGWFLAFTIFYSVFFLCDFIYWKVLYHEGSVENEEKGMAALNDFIKMWSGYSIFLGIWLFSIFSSGWLQSIWQVAALIAAFISIVVVDFTIIPVIRNIFGFPGFTIQNILKGLQDVLLGVVQEFVAILGSFFSGGAAPEVPKK